MKWLAIAAAWVLSTGSAIAAHETTTIGGVAVDVWSADAPVDSPQPVIVFSHGFHACATQSRFLMEAFASAGYLVIAPNHRDATCRGGLARLTRQLHTALRNPDQWNEDAFRDRAEDIRHLVDALGTDERFHARADLTRLALAGHSLGGYTVLGLAGAWPGWKMAEVKAVLALTPYSQPFLAHATLGGISAPVMFQGGTLDFGTTPALRDDSGTFAQSPAPKYFVDFDGASHFAWTNLGLGHRREIVAYSVAFMDRYVKDEPAADVLTQTLPGVATFQFSPKPGT
jgi:predicted dienelactone hydrolase